MVSMNFFGLIITEVFKIIHFTGGSIWSSAFMGMVLLVGTILFICCKEELKRARANVNTIEQETIES